MSSAERIALTGGIASGKTTVARMFTDLGAVVLDADVFAREAVRPGSPSWGRLRELLGPEYFTADGELKRREVRELIIKDSRLRSGINAILHPAVIDAMEQQWGRLRERQPCPIVIFDIPLLFEANLEDRFTKIILVYVPPEIQVERLMARDGVSRREARATLSMQLPIESKKDHSHFIIDNGGTPDRTRIQAESIWKELTACNL